MGCQNSKQKNENHEKNIYQIPQKSLPQNTTINPILMVKIEDNCQENIHGKSIDLQNPKQKNSILNDKIEESCKENVSCGSEKIFKKQIKVIDIRQNNLQNICLGSTKDNSPTKQYKKSLSKSSKTLCSSFGEPQHQNLYASLLVLYKSDAIDEGQYYDVIDEVKDNFKSESSKRKQNPYNNFKNKKQFQFKDCIHGQQPEDNHFSESSGSIDGHISIFREDSIYRSMGMIANSSIANLDNPSEASIKRSQSPTMRLKCQSQKKINISRSLCKSPLKTKKKKLLRIAENPTHDKFITKFQ